MANLGSYSYAYTTKLAKAAARLTGEQIAALDKRVGVRIEDRFALSRIDDDERRDIAVELFCQGLDIDAAIAEAAVRTPGVVEKQRRRQAADLTDEQWLEKYCGQIRAEIQDRSQFDVDAILWRRTLGARSLDVARNRKDIQRAFIEARSPFADLFRQVLFADQPKNWLVCGCCNGRNVSHPDCPGCNGRGYVLKTLWP